MATQASMMFRRCATQLLQTTSVTNTTASSANFHSSQTRHLTKNEKGVFTCTLIPGDGVRLSSLLRAHMEPNIRWGRRDT
jgi:hypothetical protein